VEKTKKITTERAGRTFRPIQEGRLKNETTVVTCGVDQINEEVELNTNEAERN